MKTSTRMRRAALMVPLLLGAGCFSGGYDGFGSSGWGPAPPAPPPPPGSDIPASCRPDLRTSEVVENLQSAARDSLAELASCGRTQVGLVRSMMAVMLGSNDAFFKNPSDYQELVSLAQEFGIDVDVPFTPLGDGTWTMDIPGRSNSAFSVQFFEPGVAQPITEDVFALDSYLRGARVESDHTLAEMRADPTLRTVFTVYWDEKGPLGHLLAGPEIANPFALRVSLFDLVDVSLGGGTIFKKPGNPDFGPLITLAFIEMTSAIDLHESQSGAVVHAVATSERATTGDVGTLGDLDFTVDVQATLGEYRAKLNGGRLSFKGGRNLRGDVTLHIEGPGVDLEALSPLIGGCPSTTWRCVDSGDEGWPAPCWTSSAWSTD